jgi:hypothetical protein
LPKPRTEKFKVFFFAKSDIIKKPWEFKGLQGLGPQTSYDMIKRSLPVPVNTPIHLHTIVSAVLLLAVLYMTSAVPGICVLILATRPSLMVLCFPKGCSII